MLTHFLQTHKVREVTLMQAVRRLKVSDGCSFLIQVDISVFLTPASY